MSAERTVASSARFRGWWVVGAVFLLLMTNSGLSFYGLAVYLEAITAERSLSTSIVSLATAMFFVIGGVVGRLVAPLIERFDLRIVVMAGAICSALSLLLIGRVDGAVELFAVYAVFAVGFAAAGLVPATTLIARWFQQRRGIALAIASTGLSVGGLTFTRLASELIDRNGLDGAGPWLALVYLVASAIAVVGMWPSPRAVGQLPYGAGPDASIEDQAPDAIDGNAYRQAIRTRFFVVISIGSVFVMGAQVGAIAQLAKLGAERVDRPAGALAISVMAGASIVSRLVGGVAVRHVPMVAMMAVLSALQAASLAWFAVAGSRTSLLAAALVFGITIGNLLMLQPLLIAEAFSTALYARVFALQQLIVTAGIAAGPLVLGVLRDVSSYRLSYFVAGAMSALGAAILTRAGTWRPAALLEDARAA